MITKTPYPLPAKQDIVETVPMERDYLDMHATASPIHRAKFPFGGDGWIITGYEELRQVLEDERFGIEEAAELDDYPRIRQIEVGRPFPPSFNEYDPPKHTVKRSVLMKHLTVKRVRTLRPATEQLVEAQLDAFEALGPGADIGEHFARLIPVQVFGHLVGVPETEYGRFLHAAHTFSNSRAETNEQAEEALNTLKDYFAELVDRRRTEPGEDLISALVQDTDAGQKWTEEELHGIGMVLLMAGHDATGAMLAGIIEWLSHDKPLYDRLRANPASFPRAFDELVRFIPAGLAGTRTRIAYEDVQVGDVLIRKGESVLPIVHAANFDPEVFPDPMRLDLDRENTTPHVAFGHGAHACVGQQLARMQIDVAMQAIFRRYETLTNTNTDPDWAEHRLLRGPKKVEVVYTKAEDTL